MMIATLVALASMPQAIRTEKFFPGIRTVDKNHRINANPAWVTSKWIAAADAPYQEIDKGLTSVLIFTKFEDTGVWSTKAKRAYQEWSLDCQNPREALSRHSILWHRLRTRSGLRE